MGGAPAGTHRQKTGRSVALFVNAGHFLHHFALLIFPTAVISLAVDWQLTYAELLPLALGAFIANGAGSLPAGWIADKWSRKGTMAVFFFGLGMSLIACALVVSPWQLAVTLTCVGLFASIYHPVGTAMLVTDVQDVGRVLGLNGLWGNLGVAGAAMVTGTVAHYAGWKAAFAIPGAIAIIVGLAFFLTVQNVSTKRIDRPAKSSGNPSGSVAIFLGVLVISLAFNGIIFNATTIAMPKVFDEKVHGLVSTTVESGILIAAIYVLAALTQMGMGFLVDRVDLRKLLVLVPALQVPCLLLASASENLGLFVAIALTMPLIFGQVVINDTLVARYSTEQFRARAYALRYVITFSASATAVPLVAFTQASAMGFKLLFGVLAMFSLIVSVTVLALPRQQSLR